VIGTDIFDYSGESMPPCWLRTQDFLDPQAETPVVDWIITNPPFEEKALAFALRAIELAEVGVAMFVPLRWLETIERYERLFKPMPPTQVAFFVERVNLCQGRWDPTGGTATAYIWLVWLRDKAPLPPFWIPPGRREARSRPGDVPRFTAHPVRLLAPPPVFVGVDMAAPGADRTVAFAKDPTTGKIFEIDPETGEILGDPAPSNEIEESYEVQSEPPPAAERTGDSDHDECARDEERPAGEQGDSGGGDHDDRRGIREVDEERAEQAGDPSAGEGRDQEPASAADAGRHRDGDRRALAPEGLVLPVAPIPPPAADPEPPASGIAAQGEQAGDDSNPGGSDEVAPESGVTGKHPGEAAENSPPVADVVPTTAASPTIIGLPTKREAAHNAFARATGLTPDRRGVPPGQPGNEDGLDIPPFMRRKK
jgi:hypothetical protein